MSVIDEALGRTQKKKNNKSNNNDNNESSSTKDKEVLDSSKFLYHWVEEEPTHESKDFWDKCVRAFVMFFLIGVAITFFKFWWPLRVVCFGLSAIIFILLIAWSKNDEKFYNSDSKFLHEFSLMSDSDFDVYIERKNALIRQMIETKMIDEKTMIGDVSVTPIETDKENPWKFKVSMRQPGRSTYSDLEKYCEYIRPRLSNGENRAEKMYVKRTKSNNEFIVIFNFHPAGAGLSKGFKYSDYIPIETDEPTTDEVEDIETTDTDDFSDFDDSDYESDSEYEDYDEYESDSESGYEYDSEDDDYDYGDDDDEEEYEYEYDKEEIGF